MSLSKILLSLVCVTTSLPSDPSLASQWQTPPATAAPDEPAARPRPARKACLKGHKKCRARAAPEVDPRLVESEAIRKQVLDVVGPMVTGSRHVEAAGLLAATAERRADPVLYLAAAEVQLADGRADGSRLGATIGWTATARELALRPVELRVAPESAAGLVEHGQYLAALALQRRDRLRLHSRGRAELIAGGALSTIGLGGLGLVTGGAVLAGKVDAAQRAYHGSDEAYRHDLAQTKDRVEAMLAVGLVSALAGAAIGVPLTIFGARDVRRARGGRERPRFRIIPGLAGVTLSGRF